MSDDTPNLVHITAPKSKQERIDFELDKAKEQGLFEDYEFIITGPDTNVVDMDALADQIARIVDKRLNQQVRRERESGTDAS